MKLGEALARIDQGMHNTCPVEVKISWIATLDQMVKLGVIDTHEGGTAVGSVAYDPETDMDTQLLIPPPFDGVYLRWLEAQICYANAEYGRYNAALSMFKSEYEAYAKWYNRTHMPKGARMRFF